MPAITYADFSGGIDRRLPINSQEANRLWTLKNAYVTTGKKLAKRRGLRKIGDGLTGPLGQRTFGLYSIAGQLVVFSEVATSWTLPAPVIKSVTSAITQSGGNWVLTDTVFAATYQSYKYVVGKYEKAGVVGWFHHIFDGGGSTEITTMPAGVLAANGQRAPAVALIASRIFVASATGENRVYFNAIGNARDWATASDAGHLSVGLQSNVPGNVRALGDFQDKLTVIFDDTIQTWNVFADPAQNAIDRRLRGIGGQAPYSLASFGNDLLFLTQSGFRSLGVSSVVDRIDDLDVGVPVDKLVRPDITACLAAQSPAASATVPTANERFQGYWLPQIGQYWTLFPLASTTRVWAYTYSKLSKLACWSQYDFPIVIKGVAELGGVIYIRSETALYEFSETNYTDDGVVMDVEVQMAFQDAKTPGVAKQFYGADFVTQGTVDVSYKYDPRDQNKESNPQTITGDTRPGDMIPVEVVAPCLAPVFRQSANAALEIDALTLYYNPLGTM